MKRGDIMLLDKSTFFVKERVAMLKLSDTYDILDPETQQQIGIAKEELPGWAKFLRLLVNKHFLPTKINIYENEQQSPVFSIQKPFSFLSSKVSVFDGNGIYLGYFKSKLFSLGGGFWVFDAQNQQVAEIKGDWKGWNFKFIDKQGMEFGTVTKKWAGIGKELFTSADNYIISLGKILGEKTATTILLLAAGLAVDIVFKEKG